MVCKGGSPFRTWTSLEIKWRQSDIKVANLGQKFSDLFVFIYFKNIIPNYIFNTE